MNTSPNNKTTGSAQPQAAQFKVAELEPRLENMWAGTVPGGNDVETAEPTKK